jgi:hypothetical protein
MACIHKAGDSMSTAAEAVSVRDTTASGTSAPVRAILVGGGLAGRCDIIYAMLRWSWRVPRVVAGGLLGPQTLQSESWGIWTLGLVLHFSIAMIGAAIYYAASKKLVFLKQHAVICGLFYGIAVYLVMNLAVVPLSALHRTNDLAQAALREGLLGHMVLVGLPIALSVKRWGGR